MSNGRLARSAVPAVLAVLLLAACAGKPSKTDVEADGPSLSGLRAEDVQDAVPRQEPLARYGNHSPYEVFGKKYYVLSSSTGYHKQGIASWYGSKFHGRRTSSGEPYDMHLATAAHKTLPLPTYAEVTNLENGKKIIVKINDRGPFKDDRLIDLSYGAALRLDMIATGTARVDLRVIDPDEWSGGVRTTAAPAPVATDTALESRDPTWLQAGAYGSRENAEQLASRLERSRLTPVTIHESGNLFKVWLGPYPNPAEAENVISKAIELGFERPHKIMR